MTVDEHINEEVEEEQEEWEEDTQPEAKFALLEGRACEIAEALAKAVDSCYEFEEGRAPEQVATLLDDWKETPNLSMQVDFGGLKVGERTVLTDAQAPWIRPLYLCGLTTLGIKDKRPEPEQIANLFARLARLTPDYAAVREMRDLLVADPHAYMKLQLETLATDEEEGDRVPAPPEVLAKRALALIDEVGPFAFLTYVAEIRQGKTEFDASLLEVVETRENGRAVATAIKLTDDSIDALLPVLSAPPTPLMTGLAQSFVDWATTDPTALQRLAQLMMAVGFEAFMAKLDLADMSERSLTVVGRLLKACGASAGLLGDLLSKSTAAAGVRLAAALPAEELWKLKKPVEKLLLSANPNEAHALLKILLAGQQFDWIPTLAEIVKRTKGDGIPLPVLRTLCNLIFRRRMTLDVLVPLVKGTDVKQEVRLTALRFVEQDEDALYEASQFSLGELFIPKEIRDRLKQARKKFEE